MSTNEEVALRKMSNVNMQIGIAMGVLLAATFSVHKAIKNLQEVLVDGSIPEEELPQARKEALDEMVADYSAKVN